jgi:zinc/manganese transport system ATP-binding protein
VLGMSSNPTGTVGIPPERGAVEVGGREVALALQRSQVGDTFPITVAEAVAMGRWRRLGLPRPLPSRHRFVLLDEPMTGLDADATDRVTQQLRTLAASGTTIVAATHDFDVACRVDHCVLLSGGRVVSSGAPADVLTEANVASAVIPTLGR